MHAAEGAALFRPTVLHTSMSAEYGKWQQSQHHQQENRTRMTVITGTRLRS
jgi:hypothetical protein